MGRLPERQSGSSKTVLGFVYKILLIFYRLVLLCPDIHFLQIKSVFSYILLLLLGLLCLLNSFSLFSNEVVRHIIFSLHSQYHINTLKGKEISDCL